MTIVRRTGGPVPADEMPYRLYYMTGFSRQVARLETFEAEDDQAALEIAVSKDWSGTLELWKGSRHLVRLDPPEPPMAA